MNRKKFRKKLSSKRYRDLCKYILDRDNFCVFCGNPNNLTPAHVTRRSAGGDDSPQNIVCACVMRMDGSKGCHQRFDEYELKLPFDVVEMLKNEPETV